MRSLFFAALLCACTSAFGQMNPAFYDAQKIVGWYQLKDSIRQANESKDILRLLLVYANYENWRLQDVKKNILLHKIYHLADSIYSFSARKEISFRQVLDTVIRRQNLPVALYDLRKRYQQVLSDSAQLHLAIRAYQNQQPDDSHRLKDSAINLVRVISASANTKSLVSESISVSVLDTMSNENFRTVQPLLNRLAEKASYLIKAVADSLGKEVFIAVMSLPTKEFRNLFDQLKILKTGNEAMQEREARRLQQEAKVFITAPAEAVMQPAAATPPAPSLIDLNFPTQSDIIDAIAIYLARRTKREAALLFLEKLNKAIASNQLAQELFPKTWAVMQEMDYYSAPRFGAKWRNAIATDYISLPQNIVNSNYILSRIGNKEIYNYLKDAVTFGNYVAKKYSFIDIVNIFYHDRNRLKGKWTTIGIDAMQIVNTELRDTNRTAFTWIHPASFMALSKDELHCLHDLVRVRYEDKVSPAFAVLMGRADTVRRRTLSYQLFYMELLTMLKQFSDIQNTSAKRAEDGTVVTSDGFWDAQRTFLDFLLDTTTIIRLSSRERKGLELCKNAFYVYDYLSNKNYIAAAEHALTIVSGLTQGNPRQLINLSPNQERRVAAKAPVLLKKIQAANNQFADWIALTRLKQLAEKETVDTIRLRDEFWFSAALPDTTFITGKLVDTAKLRRITSSMKAEIGNQYKALRDSIEKRIDDKVAYAFKNADELKDTFFFWASNVMEKENSNFFRWLSDFAGLLTEISATKKSDELANVIESYAMPPGSYRVKRNSNFSIDLNAYTGFYAGTERIRDQNKGALVYGFTAPVGFSFTWGISRRMKPLEESDGGTYLSKRGWLKKRSQSSLTLDLSLIDVGAMVSYRFSDEQKGLPNKVSWDQVLSFGANLRYGIRGTPFCVGAGFQRLPKLRTVKDLTSGNSVQQDAFRWHVTAAFDLPLLNIYRSF